jgi:cytochrome oxidase Cu insertion factor (SCO1/SenC/PrrC family)
MTSADRVGTLVRLLFGIALAAEYFGLSYEKQNGQVIHNLRTALLDADGNIFELYLGNQWKPADVTAQLQELQK